MNFLLNFQLANRFATLIMTLTFFPTNHCIVYFGKKLYRSVFLIPKHYLKLSLPHKLKGKPKILSVFNFSVALLGCEYFPAKIQDKITLNKNLTAVLV